MKRCILWTFDTQLADSYSPSSTDVIKRNVGIPPVYSDWGWVGHPYIHTLTIPIDNTPTVHTCTEDKHIVAAVSMISFHVSGITIREITFEQIYTCQMCHSDRNYPSIDCKPQVNILQEPLGKYNYCKHFFQKMDL